MRKTSYAILLIVCSLNAYSWGQVGHQMVAEIAKAYASKAVQDSVNKYLDGLTWEQAATWMDDVRGEKKYNYMDTWHYINIEKDKTYVAGADAENCVAIIQRAVDQLSEKAKRDHAQINADLKLLFHLVGDEHQPLHVGYGADRGGNDVEVEYFGKHVKLHHLWDITILESHLADVQKAINELCRISNKEEIKKLQAGTAVDWMNEGRTYLVQVYDFEKYMISKDYDKKATALIEKQIFTAGVRLAGVLNKVFAK